MWGLAGPLVHGHSSAFFCKINITLRQCGNLHGNVQQHHLCFIAELSIAAAGAAESEATTSFLPAQHCHLQYCQPAKLKQLDWLGFVPALGTV